MVNPSIFVIVGKIMNYKDIHVLVTDGDGRQTLTIVNGLKKIGCKVSAICPNKSSLCYVSRLPDEKILFSFKSKSKNITKDFKDFILELAKTGKYNVILPISDFSTGAVVSIQDELNKYVKIACAPKDAYERTFNKQVTFEAAINNNVPCPHTRLSDQSIDEYIKEISFPIIIKPRQGMGSIGFHKFLDENEFRNKLLDKDFNPDLYVIQEFIEFDRRVDAFIFVDQNGCFKTSMAVEVLRWYPIDAGTATFTRTVDYPEVIKYGKEILSALNYRGFADVSFMIDKKDNTPKLMEINGRIPAGLKLSMYCGFNVARQLVEMSYGESVIDYGDNKKFGLRARHSQADFMWFLKSKDRFRSKPSWFSNYKTTDLVFWINDPLPSVVYTFSALSKYKSFIEKRKH